MKLPFNKVHRQNSQTGAACVYIWSTLLFFLVESFLLSMEDDLKEIEVVPLWEC